MSAATTPDFNFAYAADFDDTATTKVIAANIFKTHPQNPPRFIIANGDFAYYSSSASSTDRRKAIDRWFSEFIKPMTAVPIWPTLGNHDKHEPDYYMQKFRATNPKLTKWIYDFTFGNAFFLMLNTESLHTRDSPQYAYAKDRLEKSTAKWKIVSFHKSIQCSDGGHNPFTSFQHFQELFDRTGVDLVLQGHSHNYERSYPCSYNSSNPSHPRINDTRQRDYIDPLGQIYVVAGTSGRTLYDLDSCEPHFYEQAYAHGHLRFRIMENGTKLQGRFYDKSLKIQDEFSIKKTQV